MSDTVSFYDMLNGSRYGEIVFGISNRLAPQVDKVVKCLEQGIGYQIPEVNTPEMREEVEGLWSNPKLKLSHYFSAPKIKNLLLSDMFSRFAESAYSSMTYYDMFAPEGQEIMLKYFEAITPYLGLFGQRVKEITDTIGPKTYRSEYEYVVAYTLLLLLMPLTGSVDFKALGALGGLRSDGFPTRDNPHMVKFLTKLKENYNNGDADRYYTFLFSYFQIGVISNFTCDIEATLERSHAMHMGGDIIKFVLSEYPTELVISAATILCPLLFSDNMFMKLHIFCRILWHPLDIYPDRFTKLWLPFGYIDKLAEADNLEKFQSELMGVPRMTESHEFLQIREILKGVDMNSVLDLTPASTALLKYQVYCTILLPLIENLAYNKRLIQVLSQDSKLCIEVGQWVYDAFREECLRDTSLRDKLLAGDLSVSFKDSTESETKLLDIREKLIANQFQRL